MEGENTEASQTTAHRMIRYFYDNMAIGRDAWDVAFWNEFSCKNPDITMDPKMLRSYFFTNIMTDAEEFEGLEYEVLQYINPLFNRIRAEVLEYRDLVEGIDFVFDRNGESPSVEGCLRPIELELGSASSIVTLGRHVSGKRSVTPTTEEILRYVSDGLSELVWTHDEKSSEPSLTVSECLQRIALLTQNGIPLLKCVEPGMGCYERFKRMGFIEPVEDVPISADGSGDEYGQFQAPQGVSTPLVVARLHSNLASAKDSALGRSIQDKHSGSLDEARPSCSYRTPTGILPTRNYDATLKRIRVKRSRFNP